MAKSRPSHSKKQSTIVQSKSILNTTRPPRTRQKSLHTPSSFLTNATAYLQSGQPHLALPLAQQALLLLQSPGQKPIASLPAFNLLGEIQLELGDPSAAAECFLQAVGLDPEGLVPEGDGGGAEKFLWLAQLCDNGGYESIAWFEKGLSILERELRLLDDSIQLEGDAHVDRRGEAEEKRRKVAAALCGMVEVWMTDLSLEPLAEENCTFLITRALLHTPPSGDPYPSTLQTLASLRLSQSRPEDARSALSRSLKFWTHLSPSDPDVPDFPTRISLSRLLMESEMEEQALEVLEGLVAEEDSSVEAWYLGGWCLRLLGEKLTTRREEAGKIKSKNGATPVLRDIRCGKDEEEEEKEVGEERKALMVASRDWLSNSLRLYDVSEYEDERLRDHALELVRELDAELGEGKENEEEVEEELWQSEDNEDVGTGDENWGEEDRDMHGT